MAEPARYVARIVARREVEVRTREGDVVRVVRITYRANNFAPRTIWLVAEEATPENAAKLIREDLSSLLGRPVEVELVGL